MLKRGSESGTEKYQQYRCKSLRIAQRDERQSAASRPEGQQVGDAEAFGHETRRNFKKGRRGPPRRAEQADLHKG